MAPWEILPDRSEIQVWFVELVADATTIADCASFLSADERERASRFRFDHLKAAFTLSRGILRVLLGRYLGVEPAAVRFAYGSRGKPRLVSPASSLEFNLAHSGRLAAYAFAVGCELGVDVEEVRSVPGQERIVGRFFSPEERAEWFGLDPSQRDEAFFRCWTGKEAYIKAVGGGLSMGLDAFRVSLRPEAPVPPDRTPGGLEAVGGWPLRSLKPAEGYAGALVVSGPARSVHARPLLTAASVLDLVKA